MSNDKDDLVAVMLPRDVVERTASNSGAPLLLIQDACKKALRPESPYMAKLCNMKNGQAHPDSRQEIFDWIKYVLENGWEVEAGE